MKDTCTTAIEGRPYDAYGALDFLARQPFVDPERVASMGFSAGGLATLKAVQLGATETLMDRKFEAAIAFYPPCADVGGNMAVPTLILAAELDQWNPAKDCQRLMAQRTGEGSDIQLVVYPSAHHGFVSEDFKPGRQVLGRWIEYNEAATARSIDDVHNFLKAAFGR